MLLQQLGQMIYELLLHKILQTDKQVVLVDPYRHGNDAREAGANWRECLPNANRGCDICVGLYGNCTNSSRSGVCLKRLSTLSMLSTQC